MGIMARSDRCFHASMRPIFTQVVAAVRSRGAAPPQQHRPESPASSVVSLDDAFSCDGSDVSVAAAESAESASKAATAAAAAAAACVELKLVRAIGQNSCPLPSKRVASTPRLRRGWFAEPSWTDPCPAEQCTS